MTPWLRRLAARTRTWLRPGAGDRDFDQELDTHLALLVDENIRRGMPPSDAARAAKISLGNPALIREARRETAGLPILDALLQDARYASRILRRSPGFSAVAILTLALGIGANAAVFSVVNAVVLKPLPYPDADRLVNVFQVQPQQENRGAGWSYQNFLELRATNHVFEDVAGSQHHQLTLTGRGDPFPVNTSVVTPEIFAVLEAKPLLGRPFTSRDGEPGAAPVVILSEALWRGPFNADPEIVGQPVDLDNRSFTIVGVMPAPVRFPVVTQPDQLWVPVRQDPLFGPWTPQRQGHWLQVTGRLKPGVSSAQAQADLDAIAARLGQAWPAQNAGWGIRTMPLQQMFVGTVRSPLLVLLAAVALVLLIACANVANLLLSRATLRSREIAVRAALGAGRWRLVRQLLTETAVLGACGCLAGLAVAVPAVRALAVAVPASVPRVNDIRLDPAVFAFAVVISVAATLAFGLAPSLSAARVDIERRLREDGRAGESAGRRRARGLLASAEIALALVLLTTAGLVVRSFANLTNVHPGFNASQLLKAEISLPRFSYASPDRWRSFARDLLARVRAQPGLEQTAIAIPAPIADGTVNLAFTIVGRIAPSANASRTADFVAISPDYFQVMDVPLLSGRPFDDHDRADSRRVCIISATMARLSFPGENPIGRRLRFGLPPDNDVEREIVGVVGDMRDVALERAPGPMFYVPFDQAPLPGAVLVARTPMDPAAAVAAIRHEVAAIDPQLPVTDVGMMPELLQASLAEQRFRSLLLGAFAAIAAALAAIGIFGVMSYSVATRTQEIGVRMALGASRSAILQMVLRETGLLAAAGLAVGVPCALVAATLVRHLLFGVSAHDPLTLAAVAVLLTVIALIAGYLPARRATSVEPTLALRT